MIVDVQHHFTPRELFKGARAPGRISRGVQRTMRTRLHLNPGQKGTKQLLAQYGDRLICVRYRYDPERKKRLTTVELLVGELTGNRDGHGRRR